MEHRGCVIWESGDIPGTWVVTVRDEGLRARAGVRLHRSGVVPHVNLTPYGPIPAFDLRSDRDQRFELERDAVHAIDAWIARLDQSAEDW